MKRREFLGLAGKASIGAAAISLTGCATGQQQAEVAADASLPELDWQMPTSWPPGLDTLFGGAQHFADRVAAMTNGRFRITARAAGELVDGLAVLDSVSEGAVPIGHTASYYYIGKTPALAFGTTVPFGLTATQQHAWLYAGGGLDMMQEMYRERFNVIQFPAGNTGTQMGGWFRREIETLNDLQGLRMRIPGLGGQVMERLGVNVQVLPGGEIFQALQTGAVDAAEWVGPYDDQKLGFQDVAQFYYFPGWWEPGPTLEVEINLDEWNNLPEQYQEVIRTAAFDANVTMLARYDSLNSVALQELLAEGVQLRQYSNEIMTAGEETAFEMYDEFAEEDSDFAEIFENWRAFRDRTYEWNSIAEGAFSAYVYDRSTGGES